MPLGKEKRGSAGARQGGEAGVRCLRRCEALLAARCPSLELWSRGAGCPKNDAVWERIDSFSALIKSGKAIEARGS